MRAIPRHAILQQQEGLRFCLRFALYTLLAFLALVSACWLIWLRRLA